MHAEVAKADLLAPGARVGRYQLLRRLAIGGMAELHLACATGVGGFQKVVVLKRVLPHLAADAGFVGMFLDEARLAAHLDHPNVVQVIDSGEAAGEYFYVMEYVHGRNVRELLGAASHADGMPLAVALTIAAGVAAALDHAHGRVDLEGRALQLVHRDVSPSNVLVSYDGAVKLTDFGIAKAATRTQETTAGAMKGKIGYMSPEQCRGESVDRRSDIFSLGVVLFELTTCERLFFGDNDFAVLNKVVEGRFDRPSVRVPGYPQELERIVLRALATDRAVRYDSADAIRRDLEAFAHSHGVRLGPEPLSQWLRASFGTPPYPRVEVRAAALDDPLESAATIVLVEGDPTIAIVRDEAPEPSEARTIARVWQQEASSLPSITAPRPRVAMIAASLAFVGALGVGAWMLSTREADSAEPASPRRESASPDLATIAPAAADPPPSSPVSAVVEPASPPEPVAHPVESGASPRSAKTKATRSPTQTRARRERERPVASTPAATPKAEQASRDLDALYPDKK